MYETNHGYGVPGPQERLASLRSPQSTDGWKESSQRKVRIEILVGALIVVIGVAVALSVLTGRRDVVQQVQEQLTSESIVPTPNPDGLLEGEGLMAFALESGDFPPDLRPGDVVRVVLTPGSDGQGEFREINEALTVSSVDQVDDSSGKTVVTVRGSAGNALNIASSGPVHLTVIDRVGDK